MEKYYFVSTEVVEKVSNILNRLSSLFGSASILAGLVEQFGLFEGVVRMDEDSHWLFTKECMDNQSFSHAEQGWSWPAFGACVENNSWRCSVGFGRHGATLVFSVSSGDLIEVHPDDIPSSRCWGTDDTEQRCAQVWAAVGKKIISRDLLERAGVWFGTPRNVFQAIFWTKDGCKHYPYFVSVEGGGSMHSACRLFRDIYADFVYDKELMEAIAAAAAEEKVEFDVPELREE